MHADWAMRRAISFTTQTPISDTQGHSGHNWTRETFRPLSKSTKQDFRIQNLSEVERLRLLDAMWPAMALQSAHCMFEGLPQLFHMSGFPWYGLILCEVCGQGETETVHPRSPNSLVPLGQRRFRPNDYCCMIPLVGKLLGQAGGSFGPSLDFVLNRIYISGIPSFFACVLDD